MTDALAELALQSGADSAVAFDADVVSLNAAFRDACRSNACGNYGQCYMCPPDVGDILTLMDAVRAYPRAVLYQTVHALEDSFDYEGMAEAGARHAAVSQRLEQRLRAQNIGPHLHLSAGGCKVCDQCAKRDALPCRHPDLAMPGMESYGVDVARTAKAAGLPYINGQNTVTYFGMVLLTEGFYAEANDPRGADGLGAML